MSRCKADVHCCWHRCCTDKVSKFVLECMITLVQSATACQVLLSLRRVYASVCEVARQKGNVRGKKSSASESLITFIHHWLFSKRALLPALVDWNGFQQLTCVVGFGIVTGGLPKALLPGVRPQGINRKEPYGSLWLKVEKFCISMCETVCA